MVANIQKEKECLKCHRVLPLTMFYKRTRSKDGRSSECKECQLKRSKELRKKRKEKPVKRVIPTEKVCRKCQRLLPSSEFYKNMDRSDGLAIYCKECKKMMYGEYYSRPEVKERRKNKEK